MTATTENSGWIPADGAAAAKILPLMRQADALCCNSYIISARSALVVIDPGALDEQTNRIRQVLAGEYAAQQRPVFFLLTHCHHDHSRSLAFWRRQKDFPVKLLTQEAGAEAVRNGDLNLTLSYIYSQDFPSVSIDYPLSFVGSDTIPLAAGVVVSGSSDTQGACSVRRRFLRLQDGISLELLQTPGHSPDSLCFRLGSLLFTGDILLADKPGVAGIPGWSQPQLLAALHFLEHLLGQGAIATCCPGHGAMLGAAEVLGMLRAEARHAEQLHHLVCFDDQRLDFLKACAVTLAREAALQFAVLGGRLHLAAHRLDELGEERLAQELVSGIDLDAMETFLVQFQDFAAGHDKDTFRCAIPLRGVQMIGKIGSLLAQAKIPAGIASTSVRRIELLLRDYINIVAGLDLRDFLVPGDAVGLLRTALTACSPPELSEAELDAAADSPELFGRFLARRLYQLPDCSAVAVKFPGAPLPLVRTDPERLTQLFADCLEQFAAAAGTAEVSFRQEGDFVAVCLDRRSGEAALSSGKAGYYDCMMGLLGGGFSHGLTSGAEQACFRIPICS